MSVRLIACAQGDDGDPCVWVEVASRPLAMAASAVQVLAAGLMSPEECAGAHDPGMLTDDEARLSTVTLYYVL